MQPDQPSTDDPNELFDLIDEHDRVIGTVRRGEAHADPALRHRSVQVLVFASDGRVLLQRRSARKDLFPGFYCASASGHVAAGEDYTATAHREVQEELGVALPLIGAGKRWVYSPSETEMTALYLARADGPFRFHPTETDGGEFFALADLRAGGDAAALPMTPALLAALDVLPAPETVAGLRALFPAAESTPPPIGPAETL
jgi:isopentenyl-diphosphate Delta-isomerase